MFHFPTWKTIELPLYYAGVIVICSHDKARGVGNSHGIDFFTYMYPSKTNGRY